MKITLLLIGSIMVFWAGVTLGVIAQAKSNTPLKHSRRAYMGIFLTCLVIGMAAVIVAGLQ